jgi:lysylphosphatidylglycerol synthetase-like protein (DUF2156 family)
VFVPRLHVERRQSLPWFVYDQFRAVVAVATGIVGFVGALVWAIIRGSWDDVGWAALFLLIGVVFALWLRWDWTHRPRTDS